VPERRFPPPWSVEETDAKLKRQCFVVSDASGRERRSEKSLTGNSFVVYATARKARMVCDR
jgi:hypothetical protein